VRRSSKRGARIRKFLIALTRNPISLLGAAITTASAVLIVTLFAIELFGFLGNPYIGIIAFLVLPAVFLVGLLLIPLGIVRERKLARRAREKGQPPPRFPVIDLNLDQTRKWVLLFVVMTAANVVILAVATYKGVEVVESTEFCGTACHSVMAPEYTAYERSPHSRVKCVACHIGPGADCFVKSKLSGAWQVISVAFDLYPTPIPTPVHDLRPARETCEQCHWPTKFVGDRLRVITHHADDEANSELKTVLLMHIGGLDGAASEGIHWHVDPDIQIRYRSDETREKIYEVELTGADGTVKRYFVEGDTDSEGGAPEEWRIMDCVDCHNRPSHVFRMPSEEVDLALQQGRIPGSLPYIRREGIRVLKAEYSTHEEARHGIALAINSFYEMSYPDLPRGPGSAVQQAGQTLGEIHCTNVFPSMNVSWGTYPNHIGHETSTGCFRCHNDEHATADGEVISQDCFTCHALLAIEEEAPEILETLDQ
jgi:hypothetical protein